MSRRGGRRSMRHSTRCFTASKPIAPRAIASPTAAATSSARNTSINRRTCTNSRLPCLPIRARRAVILERQELAGHADLDTVALRVRLAVDGHVEVDRRHDAVAEFLLDQRLPGQAVDLSLIHISE